jgi:hypothetical protein
LCSLHCALTSHWTTDTPNDGILLHCTKVFKVVTKAEKISRPVTRLYSLLLAMIWASIIFAFSVALLITANRLQSHRHCEGAFSQGFNNDFDRYRCELTIRYVGTNLEFTIPAPN